MARFRLRGTNWEGRKFIVSAGLAVLLNEIEAVDPTRRKADGTVASERHDELSPESDHRPYPYVGPGVVRGADIGEASDATGDELANFLVASRDRRIKYIIHDGMSCWSVRRNGYPAWAWQPYKGINPHEHHNHISVLSNADNDTSPWGWGQEEEDEDMPSAQEVADAVWAATPGGVAYGNAWQTLIRVKSNTDKTLTMLGQVVNLAELTDEELQAIGDAVADELSERTKD